MKLTAVVQLKPTQAQAQALADTLARANAACNAISAVAWTEKLFRRVELHRAVYRDIVTTGLPSQTVIRCIGKVVDSYKLDKATARTFRPSGAIPFDDRNLTWKPADRTVSIRTIAGRIKIPYFGGPKQLQLIATRKGEADLVQKNGRFYLMATCEVATPAEYQLTSWLGGDTGIDNILTDGTVHSGSAMTSIKHRHRKLRQKQERKPSHQQNHRSGRATHWS